MSAPAGLRNPGGDAFRHEAFLYAGEEEFLAGVVPFIRAALEAGDPMMVAVDGAKIALLQSELAVDAGDVQFADMHDFGANPARIIPAWLDYVDSRSAATRIWGIGEPIWAGRSAAELVECQRHEALLNLALADAAGLSLLCPYDTATLSADVISEAHCSHPTIVQAGERLPSHTYCGLEATAAPFSEPLAEPGGHVYELAFAVSELASLRRFVARRARAARMGLGRTEDLVLAANEVASNSVRHAHGRGLLRVWEDGGALVCEVSDEGSIDDPLAGRRRPNGGELGGYGLWLANQVCDLVQVRSFEHGSAVRLHMRVP